MNVTNFYTRFKTISGGPVHLLNLSRVVLKSGHGMSIITRSFAGSCRRLLPDEVSLIVPKWMRIATGSQLIDSFLDLVFAVFLPLYIPGKSDILCFHSDASVPSLFMYRYIMRGNLPCVYYCYQPPQFVYNLKMQKRQAYAPIGYLIPILAFFHKIVDYFAVRAADEIIVFSRDYRMRCKKLYDVDAKIVSPGVDMGYAEQALPERVFKRHGLSRDVPLAVTINKLICQKNVDLLIQAMTIILRIIPEAKAIIVGDGPEKNRLSELTRKLGLRNNIIFTGFVPDMLDVYDYYAAATINVFLERDVPFGMTVLEAAACGTPTIAVRSGGALDTVIEDVTGLLVSPELSIREIALRISSMLQDKKKCTEMGEKAREYVLNFTWLACSERFVSILEEQLRRRRHDRISACSGCGLTSA